MPYYTYVYCKMYIVLFTICSQLSGLDISTMLYLFTVEFYIIIICIMEIISLDLALPLPDCLPTLYHTVSGCTQLHNAIQYNNGQVILPLLQRHTDGIQTV